VNYNLDTRDWEVDVHQAKQNYVDGLGALHGQGIIALAHDIHENTVQHLAQFMIDQAVDAGYQLVTVGECLGDPQGYWYRNVETGEPVNPALASATVTGTGRAKGEQKVKTSGTRNSMNPRFASHLDHVSTHSTVANITRPMDGPAKSGEGKAKAGGGRTRNGGNRFMGSPSGLFAFATLLAGVLATL
jgi:hypothetical protein